MHAEWDGVTESVRVVELVDRLLTVSCECLTWVHPCESDAVNALHAMHQNGNIKACKTSLHEKGVRIHMQT